MNRKLKIISLFFICALIANSVQSKEIEFLDPVVVSQSNLDLTENQHSPNLLLDSDGYLLTYAIDGLFGHTVKTLRLETEPQFNTTDEYFPFDSSVSIYAPTVQLLETKKALYYYEQYINEQSRDTSYGQLLTIYQADIPTEEELDNTISFYTVNNAYTQNPQFQKADGRVYCEMLKQQLSDPKNNKFEYFLRSVDFESTDLFLPILHFSANGKTAVAPYGDSLLIVKSWIFCTETNNFDCSEWATGYKAYIIYDNEIVSIHSLLSKDVDSEDKQPDDIFVRNINNEYLFALRQSNQLVKINFETMRFEEMLDLSLYTDKSYKKIIPIQTVDYCIAILIDENNNGTILRFNTQYEYIDSISIPFEGDVSEISQFVYDSALDMLSYAYATVTDDNNKTSRIYLQSVLFDKEIILNPPPELPSQFTVLQNYPNPFNPSTTINYALPQNGHLKVDIYNMLGQRVSTLYDNSQTAGEHQLKWDASSQSSGMYLVKVKFEDQSKSIKTMLLK